MRPMRRFYPWRPYSKTLSTSLRVRHCGACIRVTGMGRRRRAIHSQSVVDLERTPTFRIEFMASHLSIDDVAKRTGLTAHTLRYYERIGLIAPVARAAGGQRRYAASDMAWVEFLLRLRTQPMP